ncbi:MAG TPA: PP0621 family protein [Pseudomonas sp.]|nr:PP0621 family protein [Pseudomonas sp.]
MFRLLFWIALITAAVWLWRRLKPSPSAKAQTAREDAAAPMVRCAQCGVHIPQQQALAEGRLWYCSQAHLQQGPKPQ